MTKTTNLNGTRARNGTLNQPVSAVEWIPWEALSANDWNPNRQAPPEHRLLALSIIESGWTQPVVVRQEDDTLQIVDGYHRWLVMQENPDVADLTGGLVPIVRLTSDGVHARLATIRHNRARGTHYVVSMADVVNDLISDLGMEPAEVGRRLGMDAEEVDRLMDRGSMTKRGAAADFGKGWTV
jgi:ParB-like chromosome segregation protein Spo0J